MATSGEKTRVDDKQQLLLWVWENDRMVKKNISYSPGLYDIFDRILFDAGDKLDYLKAKIDRETNCITIVYGYDVGNHSINKTKTTDDGGRNGFNLAYNFSTHFQFDILDGEKHRRYQLEFKNNMRTRTQPVITEYADHDYCAMVSFNPDLSRFGMASLEDDVVALMKKRVIDLASCLGNKVQVELDGKPVRPRTFKNYVKLYLPPKAPRIYTKVNERCEICVSVGDGSFEQVSFVNNLSTINGGTHVDYIRDQIASRLVKDSKDAFLKAYNLKRYLWVFVNAHIDMPTTFESLNEEALTIKQSRVRSTCELSPDFLEKVANSKLAKKLMSKAVYKPDLERSIPSMVDGLNSCQRGILFYAFKKPIFKEIEVADICYGLFGRSSYRGRDFKGLVSTVVGMAQNFVGSHNINLFYPRGYFGTRLDGGKVHGRCSCLYTRLLPITRSIFREEDELVLHFLEEEGLSVEPTWYIPIIPMVLVNGSRWKGVEGSTFVPSYNPRDIIANLKLLLDGKEMVPMFPWYKGFKGKIEKTSFGYTTTGVVEEKEGGNALTITELPLGTCITDYQEFLTKQPFIEKYTDCGVGDGVNFQVIMKSVSLMNQAKQEGLENKFKLTQILGTGAMHLFDSEGVVKKYDDPLHILRDFYDLRLKFYVKRREAQLSKLEKERKILKNKLKFIDLVLSKEIELKDRGEVCAKLEARNFEKFPYRAAVAAGALASPKFDVLSDVAGYEYLVYIPWVYFEENERGLLKNEFKKKEAEYARLSNADAKQLWLQDLDALIKLLEEEDKSGELGAKRSRKKAPGKASKEDEASSILLDDETVKLEENQVEEPPNKKARLE